MKTSKFLTISLVIIALVIGIGIGYMISPEYSMAKHGSRQMADLGQADKYVDLRYLNAMIAHHGGAVILARQAARYSKRAEIINLANEIITNEPGAIAELYEWKKEWYSNSRKVKDMQVPQLGSYDDTFDLRFLNALIAHHEEGIVMAEEIKLKSSRPEILDNADKVIDFLTGGISMLKQWRSGWYLQ